MTSETITTSNTPRIPWIDATRGIAIILVVIGHSIGAKYIESDWEVVLGGLMFYIYAYHMHIFFFISGCTFNFNKYAEKTLKFLYARVKTLIVPYFTFELIAFLFFSLPQRTNLFLITPPIELIIQILTATRPGIPAEWLWFLPCLFLVELMYYGISKYLYPDHIIDIFAVIFLIILLVIYIPLPVTSSSIFKIAILGLIYYAIGHVFVQYWKKIFHKINLLIFSILFAVIFILIGPGIGGIWNDGASIIPLMFIQSYAVPTMMAFLGIFSTVFFVIWVYKKGINLKILEFLGKNCIVIYILHGFFLYIYIVYFSIIIDLNVFVISALVILPCIPLIYIIKRFVPWAIGK